LPRGHNIKYIRFVCVSYQELLLAEQWARKNKLKFPPIEAELQYKRHGMKEFYVFQDPQDPTCPVVIHFVLANRTFKEQIKPGIAPTCFFFVIVVVFI